VPLISSTWDSLVLALNVGVIKSSSYFNERKSINYKEELYNQCCKDFRHKSQMEKIIINHPSQLSPVLDDGWEDVPKGRSTNSIWNRPHSKVRAGDGCIVLKYNRTRELLTMEMDTIVLSTISILNVDNINPRFNIDDNIISSEKKLYVVKGVAIYPNSNVVQYSLIDIISDTILIDVSEDTLHDFSTFRYVGHVFEGLIKHPPEIQHYTNAGSSVVQVLLTNVDDIGSKLYSALCYEDHDNYKRECLEQLYNEFSLDRVLPINSGSYDQCVFGLMSVIDI
jgi:hypothetical protein